APTRAARCCRPSRRRMIGTSPGPPTGAAPPARAPRTPAGKSAPGPTPRRRSDRPSPVAVLLRRPHQPVVQRLDADLLAPSLPRPQDFRGVPPISGGDGDGPRAGPQFPQFLVVPLVGPALAARPTHRLDGTAPVLGGTVQAVGDLHELVDQRLVG